MYQIHPNARTTPDVRTEIARSTEPSGELAKRYGVSTETIRKWRKRGTEDCRDRSSRPRHLRWRATDKERAIVCHLRRMTGFALDDLTFTLQHFLPHLNHDSIYRILKAEGPRPVAGFPRSPRKVTKQFKEYDLGFVHMDFEHLPKLHVIGSGPRKRYLYVAIDRASRLVHLPSRTRKPKPVPPPSSRKRSQPFPSSDHLLLTAAAASPQRARGRPPQTRRPPPQDQTLHAPDQRHGRALQWPYRAGGAGNVHRHP